MTSAKIGELAYAAGAAGRGWSDFTTDDAPQEFVCNNGELFDSDVDVAAWKDRWEAGAVKCRRDRGWVTRWTTAPADYDFFGAQTLEIAGPWKNRVLRSVLINPHYLGDQLNRYGSGLHGSWEEDPRIREERERQNLEHEQRVRAEDAATRATGLAWLRTVADDKVKAIEENDDERVRGIGWTDAAAERRRRQDEMADHQRAIDWARARALVPDGCVLVDDGRPASRDSIGVIPARDPHVYYEVSVVCLAQNPDEATVYTTDPRWRPTLADVVRQIDAGNLRVAAPSFVPPRPVLDRFGHHALKTILCVYVGHHRVWVGRERWSYQFLVLDEKGHKVRAKAVVAEAIRQFNA